MLDSDKQKIPQYSFWEKYINLVRRFDWLMALICLLSIAVTLPYVMKIQIRSDFKEMLPDQYRSVVEMNKIQERLKSSGNLSVLIGGDNWPAMRRFINDFAFRAKAEMPNDISSIEYNARNVHQFYDRNKYLYIDYPDLKEVYTRLKRQVDYEKIKQSPFYIEFDDEPPKFEISDIEKKYTDKTSNYQHYKDGYFTNDAVDLAAVLVKPREGATDITFAEHLVAGLTKVIDELNPKSYDPSIKIAFGGRYNKMIDQYRALIGDILKTSILCVSLVGLAMLLYFKRVRMEIWMALVVMQGVFITLALARYGIGYLTSQTAFLGSIIVGNGVNYSIITLSRFLEERHADRDVKESLIIAVATTWRATLTSAVTTSAAFGVLAITKIKGFSQFGVIGGIGMVVCWATMILFLPSLVNITERFLPLNIKKISQKNLFMLISPLGKLTSNHKKLILRMAVMAIVVAVGLAVWYLPNSLEYDFSKLRFEPANQEESWETNARAQVAGIFGQSTTPSVVLAERDNQVQAICDAVEDKAKKDKIEDIFNGCKTIYDFVPENQDEKLTVLADMRELLSGSTLVFLTEKGKREVEKFRNTFNLEKLSLSDVPDEISANFEEVNGRKGLITYVYSNPSANLWNGKDLIRFANLIREVKLPDGEIIYSSGEPVIFADLLQTVAEEGPKITLYSLILVIILVILNFKRSMATVYVVGTLLVGILWLVASIAIFGIKLNFLNFVALPISFGIGVDYPVNVYQRYKLEGRGSMSKVIKSTGVAVVACSSTTVIGYSVLLISCSRALQSFGMVAVIGEFTCLTAALIALPAFINWLDKKYSSTIL